MRGKAKRFSGASRGRQKFRSPGEPTGLLHLVTLRGREADTLCRCPPGTTEDGYGSKSAHAYPDHDLGRVWKQAAECASRRIRKPDPAFRCRPVGPLEGRAAESGPAGGPQSAATIVV